MTFFDHMSKKLIRFNFLYFLVFILLCVKLINVNTINFKLYNNTPLVNDSLKNRLNT